MKRNKKKRKQRNPYLHSVHIVTGQTVHQKEEFIVIFFSGNASVNDLLNVTSNVRLTVKTQVKDHDGEVHRLQALNSYRSVRP